MKCEICGKEILKDSQCINYKYYHNDCIEILQQENKQLKQKYEMQKDSNKLLCKAITCDDCNCSVCEAHKENIKLKKQLEEYKENYQEELNENSKLSELWCDSRAKIKKLENQQKEFIDYLENEINKFKEQIKNYDIWHKIGNDINFLILKKQFYLEILQKYKEITGVSDED